MSVIATLSIPKEDFALGATISDNPGISVRLDRVIPVGRSFMPYFWAADDSIDAVEAGLRSEDDIESFEIVDTIDGEALVKVAWKDAVDGFLEALADSDAVILEGIGDPDGWQFQLRFNSHEQLSDFYRHCLEDGISVDLESVHNPGIPHAINLQTELTDEQQEMLIVALAEGYFDVPRRINLVELGERMDLSDSAVSQRIRRGISGLLEEIDLSDDQQVSDREWR